ncbi:phosphate ABC transporter permease PstA [Laspinema palackyanum]|uniref:phosphate ABC transporter permease PstA n=1 Tax=Laspinema palackyanum TaxID=3231601 RepID=UPI00345C7823|nr:phosphate ABC transporter permease PstA [Laspinema sp. D2c]
MEFHPFPPRLPEGESWQRNLGRLTWVERCLQLTLALIAGIPISISVAIAAVFLYETVLFFQTVPLWNFLSDTRWTPLFPSQNFGILVLASATLMVTGIASLFAIPIGLLIAIYLAEYASDRLRLTVKPLLEALSGIPTVVYGYFALLVVTPLLQELIPGLARFNALSAGLVTGVAIVPIISSLSEDAIKSVPHSLREAGYTLGLTKEEVLTQIVLPMAFPGIIASCMLAASRALGETMISAIAAGQNPQLTLNPLVPVATMTAFIIQVSLGTVAFNSLAFQTIFTVGMVLFLITLGLNSLGYWLVRRHQSAMTQAIVPTVPAEEGSKFYPLYDEELPRSNSRFGGGQTRSTAEFKTPLIRRQVLDRCFSVLSAIAIPITLGIVALLLLDASRRGLPLLTWQFLTSFPSRNPQEAGIYPALMGSLWLLGLTAFFALPIGLGTAIYLEEYCANTVLNQFLEINIANLTAVPSILYGLLGLELFVRLLAPVTGGPSLLSAALTLTVIILPMFIVTTRSALRSIPDGLHQAGYAMGMTRAQVLWHIVLPAAFPATLTGALLALTRAIGETAPLIAVGALSFVSFAPPLSWEGIYSRFTALPFQIFNWILRPQTAFHNNAAAAILVLVSILLILNICGVLIREKCKI